MRQRLVILTALTMIAFAANSIFCRLALSEPANDPLTFTFVRLAAGALILTPYALKHWKSYKITFRVTQLLPALMLFSYALFFSLSYVQMTAGTGALIVFPAAQLAMLVASMYSGTRLLPLEKTGMLIALSGLVYLVLPGFDVPPIRASVLMFLSGVSWGVYSVLGKSVKNPSFSTAMNFILTLPLVAPLLLVTGFQLSPSGIVWAMLSGSLTSALGYLLWYMVLKDLKTTTAAVTMLSVPAITAIGGVLFLGESLSFRIIASSILILGGLYVKVMGSNLTKVTGR